MRYRIWYLADSIRTSHDLMAPDAATAVDSVRERCSDQQCSFELLSVRVIAPS